MGIFKDMLGSEETLFKNSIALDYDYIPKLIPYREAQQKYIAACIKPLFQGRNGRNIVVYGRPGVGKTVAIKNLLTEIEEGDVEVEDEQFKIVPVYINCWKSNSTFKIILEMCEALDYKFTQNKRSDELFKIVKQMLNKRSVVFVFDEIDKAEDYDFLYNILEEIYRKTIVVITNDMAWVKNLDQRIRSRLLPDTLEFKPYNPDETRGILTERRNYAFIDGIWDDSAFSLVISKTCDIGDVRTGLYLLKESGILAEDSSSKRITPDHAKKAVEKLDEFSVNDKDDLEDETKMILDIIKGSNNSRIGDLFKAYQDKGGSAVYKTFQRKIKKLEQGKFVSLERSTGAEGNTTIVNLKEIEKKLDEY